MEIQGTESNQPEPTSFAPSNISESSLTSTVDPEHPTSTPGVNFSQAAQWAPTAFWILILAFLLRFYYKVLTSSRNRAQAPRPDNDPSRMSGESEEEPDTIDVTVPRRSMTSLLSGEMSERYRDCECVRVGNSCTPDAPSPEDLPSYRPVPRHRLRIHEMSFRENPEPANTLSQNPVLFDFTRSPSSSESHSGDRTQSPVDQPGTSCMIIIGVDETDSFVNYAAREQQNHVSETLSPVLSPERISRPSSTRSEFRFYPPAVPPPSYAP